MMKRVMIVVVLLLLVVIGYFTAAHFSGGTLPTFGLPLGGENTAVRQKALAFVEDLHFRDLTKAAQAFAPPDQNVQSVQTFLQRTFNASADQLDITKYSVDDIEVDSTGSRARVRLKVTAKNLASGQLLQPELLLFFHRSANEHWYLVTQ